MKLDLKKEMTRKKFFGTIGMGAIAAFLISSVPFKYAKSLKRNMKKKNYQVTIHPSAVKRTSKV